MDKLAHDTNLSAEDLQRVAQFGFATALASPVIGADPATTKKASDGFGQAMRQNAERHGRIKTMLLEFAKT